jgi:hypothetical protein
MSIQTFTAAQVLTAAQMNTLQANDYNQTVATKTASYTLVAADKGTRVVMNVASANTVTVNTSLFSAGDTLVIQNIGAGVTTVTAGTATVSSAGPLTIAQYGSGTLYFTSAGVSLWFPSAGPAATSALTFIASGSLSGTSTTFSNAFSATYDNYLVNINSFTGSSGYPEIKLTFGSATTNYSYSNMYSNATAGWTFSSGSASAAFIYLNQLQNISIQSNTIRIMSPFMTEKTTVLSEGMAYTASQWEYTAGAQFDATSFTSFTIASSTAATLSGTVRIYGYANS